MTPLFFGRKSQSGSAMDPMVSKIIDLHNAASSGIVQSLHAESHKLDLALCGADQTLAELFIGKTNPEFRRLLAECVDSKDEAELRAVADAAAVAEFLQVVDHALAKFGAFGPTSTINVAQVFEWLAPVVVCSAGPRHPKTVSVLSEAVVSAVDSLAEAESSAVGSAFANVLIAWKKLPADSMLSGPHNASAVKMPFCQLARLASIVSGNLHIQTNATSKHALTIERVAKSDGSMSTAEAKYFLEWVSIYAGLGKEAKAAHEKYQALPPTEAAPQVPLEHDTSGKNSAADTATVDRYAMALIRSYAVVSALDGRVSQAEFKAVLDALKPLQVDPAELRGLFESECRAVYREGVQQAAPRVASELQEVFMASSKKPLSRQQLWEGLLKAARMEDGIDSGKKAILMILKSGLDRRQESSN